MGISSCIKGEDKLEGVMGLPCPQLGRVGLKSLSQVIVKSAVHLVIFFSQKSQVLFVYLSYLYLRFLIWLLSELSIPSYL